MARVPYREREDLDPGEQRAYDVIKDGRRGHVPKVFKLFLNAPKLAARIGEVGSFVRFQTSFPADVREIAILATARHLGCQYEFTHHVRFAREAGVREAVIEGIARKSKRGFLPQESVFVDYARQVLENRVNDPTYQAVEHLLGRQGTVEMTMLVGYYAMIGHTMLALQVELEEGEEPLMPEGPP